MYKKLREQNMKRFSAEQTQKSYNFNDNCACLFMCEKLGGGAI